MGVHQISEMTKQEQFLWIVQTALLASTTTRLLRPERFKHLEAFGPVIDPGGGTFMAYHVFRMRRAIFYGARIPPEMSPVAAAEDFLESFLDECADIRSFPDYEPPEWMELPDRETQKRMWAQALRSSKQAMASGKRADLSEAAEASAQRNPAGSLQSRRPADREAAKTRQRLVQLASRTGGVQMRSLLAELPTLSRDQIKRIMQKLSSEGRVELKGSRRGAIWRAT